MFKNNGCHFESFVRTVVHSQCRWQKVFVYLIDMKEEYREVKQDDDEERQDEYDDQRGEDPQQVLQNTQIVLHLTKAGPFLQRMKHTHLWTDRRIIRSTTLILTESFQELLDGLA